MRLTREDLTKTLYDASVGVLKLNVEILSDKCCSECEKINGVTIPLETAVLLEPLPFHRCTREYGCNCCYLFHPIRDKEGELELKQYDFNPLLKKNRKF